MTENIDKLENEAMARAYDKNKPDELIKDDNEIKMESTNMSFFQISQLLKNIEGEEKASFYQSFRYIKMIDCDWLAHYILLLNGKIGMIIPNNYVIIYDDSLENNQNSGKINFREEHKNYIAEYNLSTYDDFIAHMKELEVVSECVEYFENNNQVFYEFSNGYIYMYYEGYTWSIFGYSRNDIKEYYYMYTILMSLRNLDNETYQDKENFKLIYLINKNALNYLYKGIDLKKKTLDELKEYSLMEDVVTFALDNNRYLTILDEDYQIYNRKSKDINDEIEKINLYCDPKWRFEGTFKAGVLGTYTSGDLLDFPEIINSTELSEIEKRNLLENIIKQKQIELYEYKDFISKKLLDIIINNLKQTLTNEMWNELKLVNYLYIENIDIENKTENLLYDYFKFALDNNDNELVKGLIDIDYLASKIRPQKLIIGPEFMAFACNVFKQNKIFILFENNEFIEWK